MQDTIIEPLRDIDVVRLLKFIRREEDNEHIAQLCADVSSEFAHIARYVGKVGFALSEEWKAAADKDKNAEHLVLSVKEYKTRLKAIHVRATGDHDNQGVDISQNIMKRRESKPVHFSLPEQFTEAKNYILAELFCTFPEGSLVAMKTSAEIIPLFEPLTVYKPMPADEGLVKLLAIEAANQAGDDAPMIKSPYADDNVRVRSFSR